MADYQHAGARANSAEQMMREADVAALLGVSPRSLQGWRYRGGGPPYVRVGSAVRYEPAAVRAWIDAQRRTSTSDTGGVQR